MKDDIRPSSIVPATPAQTAALAAKARLSRRQLIAGGIGLIGLSTSATGAYAGAVEPTDLLVTRLRRDAAELACGTASSRSR